MTDRIEELLKTIIRRLQSAMKNQNIRPAPLARRAELNESAVRDIVRGRSKNPGVLTLARLANALDVSVNALIDASLEVPVVGELGSDGHRVYVHAEDDCGRRLLALPTTLLESAKSNRLSLLTVESVSLRPLVSPGDFLLCCDAAEQNVAPKIGELSVTEDEHAAQYLELRRANSANMRDELISVCGSISRSFDDSVRCRASVIAALPKDFCADPVE